MYYVLMTLSALIPLVDFGFGPTIGRFVGYAMGGATSLQTHGLAKSESSGAPNYTLLWQLLFTSRSLYRILLLGLLLILGVWGTYLVELRIQETSSVAITRFAWLATLVAALFDIYSNWWVVFLRGTNDVLTAARIDVLAMTVRLVISAVLLVCGAGLLSVPIGGLLGSFIQRSLARRRCLKLLSGHPQPHKTERKRILSILWPNAWRAGMIFVGGYLTVNANTAICLHSLGLSANAQYGLSVQLLNVIAGIAGAWTAVKWPIIAQYQARHDFAAMQSVLRPRIWLQTLSFIGMSLMLLLLGPLLLAHFGNGKQVLPLGWFGLLAIGSFLDMQLGFWSTLIFVGNRLPFLWPVIAANVLSLGLSLALMHFTSIGVGALVLGPLLSGSCFNYWYWPQYACAAIGTSLFRFLFRGQVIAKAPAQHGALV
ncbi:MAG TPA: hypothetical protein VKY92_26980 [Verrucomicrobiae bacterium]|nr:hypothetical protein [Verrucomicrobiae bacterium]